jgi:hypothetical protein
MVVIAVYALDTLWLRSACANINPIVFTCSAFSTQGLLLELAFHVSVFLFAFGLLQLSQ